MITIKRSIFISLLIVATVFGAMSSIVALNFLPTEYAAYKAQRAADKQF